MTRIRLHIDRIILNGIEPREAAPLTEALRLALSEGLADADRPSWNRSYERTVLRLSPLAPEGGTGGAGSLGKRIGRAVVDGLKR